MEELKEYNGILLVASEANFLEELEHSLGKPIPCLEEHKKEEPPPPEAQAAQAAQAQAQLAQLQTQLADLEKIVDMSLEELEEYYKNYYLSMDNPETKAALEAQIAAILPIYGENHPTVLQIKSMLEMDEDKAIAMGKETAKQMKPQIPMQIEGTKAMIQRIQQPQQEEQYAYQKGISISSFGFNCYDNHVVALEIEDQDVESLPDSFDALTELLNLSISKCPLKKVPESISKLEKLEMFYFSQTKILTVPDIFQNLTKLTFLGIDNNSELRTLSESIGNLQDLNGLNLRSCAIESLPSSIGKLSKLTSINLDYNQLETLPDTLDGLTSLSELILSNNQLIELPPSFGELSALVKLELQYNRLERLPDTFGGLESLEELDCQGNSLITLPENIGNLTKLTKFSFEGNKLTKLPDSIKNLTNVTDIRLGSNKLTEFSPSICSLINLKYLIIGGGSINKLPDCIGQLKSLEWLYLNSTGLTELPSSIGDMRALKALDLSDNKLTEVPEELAKLKLTTLNLQKNQLSELPYFIYPMTSLQTLDLRGNPLSSEEQEVIDKDAMAILDYCRQRASISVMIINSEVDADAHRLSELSEFLEKQSEIFGIVPSEEANLPMTDLVMFLATAGSINSPECIKILKSAKEQGIEVVPLKGTNIGWGDLANIDLSRELGHEFTPDDFNGFCDRVYDYVQLLKHSHNIFKDKSNLVLAKASADVDAFESFATFKEEVSRILHSSKIKAFFSSYKSFFDNAYSAMLNAKIGGLGTFFLQLFLVYAQMESMIGGGF